MLQNLKHRIAGYLKANLSLLSPRELRLLLRLLCLSRSAGPPDAHTVWFSTSLFLQFDSLSKYLTQIFLAAV